MDTKFNKSGAFACQGSDGKNYRVIEYTKFVGSSDRLTGVHWTPGGKIYKLTRPPLGVKPVDQDSFEVVRTGVRLKRVV